MEGARLPYLGLNAVVGKPPEEYAMEPDSFADMRKGWYDVAARLDDMNANGVFASLNFPSFPQFCGQRFMRLQDKDYALALVRAYNDWHILEWAGAAEGRFIPCSIPPLWDPDQMAAEVRRVAALGALAVTFSENPAKLGLPSLHSDHWDPFWRACSDTGTVVCMHIGSSSSVITTADDAPADVAIALIPLNSVITLSDLVYASFLRRFPDLTIALSEGGTGWIPWTLERLDYVYQHHNAWTKTDFGGGKPSDVFRRNITTCFISDEAGVQLRDRIGVERMTWESDYPHSDCIWPNAPEVVWDQLKGLPDNEINLITHLNTMRTYRYDPFTHVDREHATVGQLRALAVNVDTAVREVRKSNAGSAPVTQGTFKTRTSVAANVPQR
jgi:predicted TIM-barrel fold metal-dependent hydrolase